jgi:hypothetical protein
MLAGRKHQVLRYHAKQAASLFFEPQGLIHTHGISIHVNAIESTYTSPLDLCSVILAQSI